MFKVILLWLANIFMINIPVPKLEFITGVLDLNVYFIGNFAYIYLHKKRKGHLALGLGSTNMSNANVIVLNKINNGNDVSIEDCYSYGEMPFNCFKAQSFEIVEKDINPNKIEVVIRRLIEVDYPLSRNFLRNARNQFIFSFTDTDIIEYHYGPNCNFGSFEILNNEISERDVEDPYALPGAILHAFLNVIFWIFITDMLIILAKFFKIIRFYHIYHGLLLFGICIYTFIIISTIWGKRIFSGRNYPPHFYASIAILVTVITEFITGMFLFLKIQFDLKKFNTIISKQTIRYIHLTLGFLCWLAVRIGCIYGALDLIHLFNIYSYYYIIITETVIFLIIFIALFIIYMGNKKLIKVKLNNKPSDTNIINKINESNYFDLLKNEFFEKKIIAFYRNRAYDLEKITHPGGNYIFKNMKFRDVTRFLFGSYGLEMDNSKNWLHTNLAYLLLEKNFIGKLDINYEFFTNTKNEYMYYLKKRVDYPNNWNIYYFVNENVEVKNHITKLNEIATYFNMKNEIGTYRNYTTIMSATKYNIDLNQKLIDYIENIMNDKKINFHFKQENYEKNLLPLVIKTYKSKIGVSEYLSNVLTEGKSKVQIEGPFGEGLFLDNSKENSITLITGGTGVLPIYDVIDLAFKNLCWKFFEKHKINLDIPELRLGNLVSNIKITLLSSFLSEADFFGIKIFNMISKIQKYLDLNLIDVNIKFSRKPTKEYSFNIFKERINKKTILEKIKDKEEKIYICGPPSLNNSVYNLLKDNDYVNFYWV